MASDRNTPVEAATLTLMPTPPPPVPSPVPYASGYAAGIADLRHALDAWTLAAQTQPGEPGLVSSVAAQEVNAHIAAELNHLPEHTARPHPPSAGNSAITGYRHALNDARDAVTRNRFLDASYDALIAGLAHQLEQTVELVQAGQLLTPRAGAGAEPLPFGD